MNLILRDIGIELIAHGNPLQHPLLQESGALFKFDAVMGNPPFSLADWGFEFLNDDRYGRFRYGLPPKGRGDYAFILHMVASMKPNSGRMAIIVPHGVLFRGGNEGYIRKNLINSNLLDAVIGLPPKLFSNTAIPTAILLFRHGREADSVLFVDASRDFEIGRKLNSLRDEDVSRVAKTCQERATIAGYSNLVSRDEIAAADFNLNISRYVREGEPDAVTPDVRMLADREATLVAELAELQHAIELRLREIGLRS